MPRINSLVGATLLLTITSVVQAQGKSRGASRQPSGSVTATVVFRDADRTAFRDYYFTNHLEAKPLPPGIAKNVARGKPLPPGIAKQALPRTIIVTRTRPVNGDIIFMMVGHDILAVRNGVVVDIMVGVFR